MKVRKKILACCPKVQQILEEKPQQGIQQKIVMETRKLVISILTITLALVVENKGI